MKSRLVSSKFSSAVIIATSLCIGASASFLAVHGDALGRESLATFSNLNALFFPLGKLLVEYAHQVIFGACLAFGALLGILGFSLRSDGSSWRESARLFPIALSLAFFAQALVLQNFLGLGAFLYFCSASVIISSNFAPWRSLQQSSVTPIDRKEFALLIAITLLGCFFRFYSLDVLPNAFEGELAPYMLGATSIPGMFYADAGMLGPWAPLGTTYYIPIFITTKLFGPTVLSLRLASAIVSLMTIPLLYLVGRKFGGKRAGLIAAALVALDPLQIGWGRSDIHPHGSTVWIALVMCLFLLRYSESGSRASLLGIVVCMGLSWHQYPSGQSIVLLPFLLFFALKIFRVENPHWNWKAFVAFLFGLALWVLGFIAPYKIFSLGELPNPVNMFGIRSSWAGTEGEDLIVTFATVVIKLLDNCAAIISGIFWKVPYFFHQTFYLEYPNITHRTVAAVAAPFLAVAIFLCLRKRNFKALLLICWIVCAALPAILSERAYDKRCSNLYPVLQILTAVSIGWLMAVFESQRRFKTLRLLQGIFCASLALFAITSTERWFSGNQFPKGVAPEVQMAEEIKPYLRPNSIIIFDGWHHYMGPKLSYLLLDSLTDPAVQPLAWYAFDRDRAKFEPLSRDPRQAIAYIPYSFVYLWTDLRKTIPRISDSKVPWDRAVFIFQADEAVGEQSAVVKQDLEMAKAGCPKILNTREVESSDLDTRMRIVECSLEPLP